MLTAPCGAVEPEVKRTTSRSYRKGSSGDHRWGWGTGRKKPCPTKPVLEATGWPAELAFTTTCISHQPLVTSHQSPPSASVISHQSPPPAPVISHYSSVTTTCTSHHSLVTNHYNLHQPLVLNFDVLSSAHQNHHKALVKPEG